MELGPDLKLGIQSHYIFLYQTPGEVSLKVVCYCAVLIIPSYQNSESRIRDTKQGIFCMLNKLSKNFLGDSLVKA